MKTHHEFAPVTPDSHIQDTLFELQKADPKIEYRFLKGHHLEDGHFKTDAELREQYLRLTDTLIGVIDGTIDGTEPYDAVIYLDKSARPVSWLVNELWDDLAREQGTEFTEHKVPKRPQTLFLNIDREQWLPTVDPMRSGAIDVNAIPESTIDQLREIYRPKPGSEETRLDGKRVLIVDEVSVTGSTLSIAQKILERALPNTEFGTTHWMSPGTYQAKDGTRRNNDIPVWYKSHDPTGRGVDNRDVVKSLNSKSRIQKIGMYFLSTAFAKIDPNSVQLRAEVKQLAKDLRDKKILFTPSIKREDSDMVARIQSVNDVTLEEFKQAKQAGPAFRK